MSRILAWAFAAGLVMLAVGLVTAASPWGAALVLVALGLLAVLAAVAMTKGLRTHGSTWDVNPGAARREAAREREAREREAQRETGR